MKLFAGDPAGEKLLWQCMGIASLLILLASAALIALFIRQKRYGWLWTCVPVFCLSYFMEQCFDSYANGIIFSAGARRVMNGFASLPDLLLVFVCVVLAAAEVLMFINLRRFGKNMITTASVKEAMDDLPSGILYYAPAASVLLANRTMRELCRKVSGSLLENGETFARTLRDGTLQAGCKRVFVGGEMVLLASDGTAWKISEGDVRYEKHTVHRMLASDITEVYRDTLQLKEMESRIEALGSKLQQVNREIVALTADREVLNAKVRIHDEFGSNLLAVKRILAHGGTAEERKACIEGLRRNVAFLKNDTPTAARDEYELLQSMAARLGLKLMISGELPQTERNKAVMATAIHECMTNTLRHAHGDELHIDLCWDEAKLTAVLTNNGEAPAGEVEEKGGLASLRELTQQAGGSMTVRIKPGFAVVIELPKEDIWHTEY